MLIPVLPALHSRRGQASSRHITAGSVPLTGAATGRWHSPWQSRIRTLPQVSLHSPVGDISVSEEDGAIVAVDWGWGSRQSETSLLRRAREQLQAYFDDELTEFALPLAPAGTTYQQRVWQALCAIPYGATRSYLDIAQVAGGSPRSVGQANGNNPIPIIIPCHRVVA